MPRTPPAASAARLEPAVRTLAAALPYEWTWDPIYCAMTASIERDDIERVTATLTRVLPHVIDKRALATASARVRDLAMWAGGVERRQRLLIDEVTTDTALFATLWPWTEDEGCTARVGLFHEDARSADREALGALLRAWFGVA